MASSRRQYPFHLIEPKWQQFWDIQQTFRAFNPGEEIPANHPFAQRHKLSGKPAASRLPPKFYILDMFPYPSGAGLHVGHPEGYTATDILARYKRALGFNVLHPMGWDAFGLPAEQYAVKTGQHPRQTTDQNIATFKRQIQSLGFSYDWSREFATTDPDYFKWTQWIFLKLYNSWFNAETNKAESIEILEDVLSENPKREWTKREYGQYVSGLRNVYVVTPVEQRAQFRHEQIDKHRLAYVTDAPVWWCPALGTVLANEEVIDGKSEVGGHPVTRRPMRQWMLRISQYAERLLNDLETIDWSDSLKEMQRNWIGRSEGATVTFPVEIPPPNRLTIDVFTTRPDTLFGATYMVLAPEHWLIDFILALADQNHRVNEQITSARVRVFSSEPKSPEDLNLDEALSRAKARGIDLIEVNPAVTPPACILEDYGQFRFYQQGVSKQSKAIRDYREQVAKKSDLERTELAKEKTGVFTGAYAINPVNGQKIPIWIADYVLISYGTGAIMAVPAHDTHDFEFAAKFNLPVVQVVQPPDPKIDWRGFVDDGTSVNSTSPEISITGLPTAEAKKKITAWLESKGLGKKTVIYKLRDWLFSRQRYWGEPFPIVWKKDSAGNLYHEALPESALPVLPPELTDYKPTGTGEPPLARAQSWVNEIEGAQRETNTMPQWAGSCWYYLRYLDAKNSSAFVGREAEQYWMSSRRGNEADTPNSANPPPHVGGYKPQGVDLYVGGTEHAVLHLLYARFWHKMLFDLGYVSTPEPFFKLVNQGLILGEMEFFAFRGTSEYERWVSAEEVTDIEEAGQTLVGKRRIGSEILTAEKIEDTDVEKVGPWFYLKNQGNLRIRVETRCYKMSKSRGNVVNPDDILGEYGADAFRLYEMFIGPLEMVKPWSTKGVEGVYRFLGRVWRLFVDEKSETEFEQAETVAECSVEPAAREIGAQRRHNEELLDLIKLDSAIKDVAATPAQLKTLHACIKKVTEDLDGLRFNTAISALMVFVNDAMTWETKPVSVLRDFLILLQPFAPHLAEELWTKLNLAFSLRHLALPYTPWPKFDLGILREDTVETPVQIDSKKRQVIKTPANASKEELERIVHLDPSVAPYREDKYITKVRGQSGRFISIETRDIGKMAESFVKQHLEQTLGGNVVLPSQPNAGFDMVHQPSGTFIEVKSTGSYAPIDPQGFSVSQSQFQKMAEAAAQNRKYEVHFVSGLSPQADQPTEYYKIPATEIVNHLKPGSSGTYYFELPPEKEKYREKI